MEGEVIGGHLITHNCLEYDYCLEASLDSLLAFCSEVSVTDAESTDGTWHFLRDKASKDPRIKLSHHVWRPNEMGKWLADLTNFCRSKLSTPIQFQLQADEVVHEKSIPLIRQMAETNTLVLIRRLNFWKNHKHLVPEGKVCSSMVFRLGPSSIPAGGDAESLYCPTCPNAVCREIEIFHYGFIRKPDAFVKKSIPMQEAFFNTHDPVLDRMKEEGSAPLDTYFGNEGLRGYTGTHPKFAHKWLKEHNYAV